MRTCSSNMYGCDRVNIHIMSMNMQCKLTCIHSEHHTHIHICLRAVGVRHFLTHGNSHLLLPSFSIDKRRQNRSSGYMQSSTKATKIQNISSRMWRRLSCREQSFPRRIKHHSGSTDKESQGAQTAPNPETVIA